MDDENAEELSSEWAEGRSGAREITARENGTFVGLYGFEMTWSGGAPGHINTFNSDGFESRNYAPYKKATTTKYCRHISIPSTRIRRLSPSSTILEIHSEISWTLPSMTQ